MVDRANQTVQNISDHIFIFRYSDFWDSFRFDFVILSCNEIGTLVYRLWCCLMYRSSVHEATEVSPSCFENKYLSLDLIFGKVQHQNQTQLARQIRNVHEYARTNLKITAETMKRRYDKNINFHEYHMGDAVLIHNPTWKEGLSPELPHHWIGPFE